MVSTIHGGFPDGAVVKNLPANAGDARDAGSVPGLGKSSEEEMATYSSILSWELPWAEEPGGLQSLKLQGVVGHSWATEHTHSPIHNI